MRKLILLLFIALLCSNIYAVDILVLARKVGISDSTIDTTALSTDELIDLKRRMHYGTLLDVYETGTDLGRRVVLPRFLIIRVPITLAQAKNYIRTNYNVSGDMIKERAYYIVPKAMDSLITLSNDSSIVELTGQQAQELVQEYIQ